jgi:type IV pilus assembly protein PilP
VAYSKLLFLCRNRYYLQIGCAIILACLTGCGNDDFSDLSQYISTVKAVPKGTIRPLPEIKVVEAFMFNPKGLRDPFKPLVQPERQDTVPELSAGGGIKPDTIRRKEELEAFPLELFKMVGTIEEKPRKVGTPSKMWGLVKTDDGTIHRVQVGNYMGRNYGKIIRISIDKIELMEIVSDKPGSWREQQTSLAITE